MSRRACAVSQFGLAMSCVSIQRSIELAITSWDRRVRWPSAACTRRGRFAPGYRAPPRRTPDGNLTSKNQDRAKTAPLRKWMFTWRSD